MVPTASRYVKPPEPGYDLASMQVDLRETWRLGPVEIPSRLVLAPMAGVSVQAFRRQGRRYGAGLVCSEMVSCAGLSHQNERTLGYLRIARESDPADRIVEAPWHYDYVAFAVYQRFHRRRTFVGFVTPPGDPLPLGELDLRDPRFALRKFVHVGDVAALRGRGVRYVIFHRNRYLRHRAQEIEKRLEAEPGLEAVHRAEEAIVYEIDAAASPDN